LLSVLGALLFAAVLALVCWFGLRWIGRGQLARRDAAARRLLGLAWIGLTTIGLLWLAGSVTVPVPRSPSPPASAVGSLRSSAEDMALFLIELAHPRLLDPELAEDIRTPQIDIDEDFSWGFGPGIQHSRHGDALWQMGITFGFRSVMVIYPEQGLGVVVLTNSDDGLPVAYDVAARALGGKAYWASF